MRLLTAGFVGMLCGLAVQKFFPADDWRSWVAMLALAVVYTALTAMTGCN